MTMASVAARLLAGIALALAILLSVLLTSSTAGAEAYVAGMLGGVFPDNLDDVQDGAGGRYADLSTDAGFATGAKLGYFFPEVSWLGVETEVFVAFPRVRGQTVPGSGPGCPCTLATSGGNMQVVTWAFNAIARYPHERFQPYAGLGLGLFFADLNTRSSEWDSGVPGLNVLAGLRYVIDRRFAVFGEYKYNHASFTFDRAVEVSTGGFTSLKADYSANLFVVGFSFRFK